MNIDEIVITVSTLVAMAALAWWTYCYVIMLFGSEESIRRVATGLNMGMAFSVSQPVSARTAALSFIAAALLLAGCAYMDLQLGAGFWASLMIVNLMRYRTNNKKHMRSRLASLVLTNHRLTSEPYQK